MNPEGRILGILGREGSLTGGELLPAWGGDRFTLWKTCVTSPSIRIIRIGRRYLRLDERVEGYSRLSPSILREFLTYTIVGTEERAMQERADALLEQIRGIGEWKTAIAAETIRTVLAAVSAEWKGFRPPCLVLAGDIAYGMAHAEPRLERSTEKMVKGSDLDIVAVLDDALPDALVTLLDEEIYRHKYRLLVNPAINQEIDYVVKRVAKFREQLGFDTFKRMVACKIMRESLFLGGDRELFDELKLLVEESGIGGRIAAMETRAARDRADTEELLKGTDTMTPELSALFYSSQESEEFE